MANEVYDYLKKWDGWVPADFHSQAKWAQDVAKEFGVSPQQAAEWIVEYNRRKQETNNER